MRTLKRNKTILYLASRDLSEKEYMKFNAPVAVDINFAIANSEQDVAAFGENYINIARSNATPEQLLLFKESDRIYLSVPLVDGIPVINLYLTTDQFLYVTTDDYLYVSVEDYDTLASEADYRVKSVINSINNTQIIYEKMSDA